MTCSSTRSKSTDNFSPPHRQDRLPINNPRPVGSPSHRRGLDPALRAFDDMSSPFVPAILNQDAPPHFALPKFQMYNGLQDPFDYLMHFRQIMTLQMGNNALLCKVFPSSLAGPTLSWFHRLAPNTVTSFRCFFEKFVTQYMCLVMRKQSVTSLFHFRMGRSESIMDFMKRYRAAILQLNVVSLNTVLQAVKQAIRPYTQFFGSLLLNPSTTIDKLFQRVNQYTMLEDDIVTATKRTVATTSDSRHYDKSKGKRGRDEQDRRDKRDPRDLGRTGHHIEVGDPNRAVENLRQDNNTKSSQNLL